MTIKIEYSPSQVNTRTEFAGKSAYDFLGYCWPENVPQKEKIKYVIRFFKLLGFKKSSNSKVKQGFEKIAILVDSSDKPIGVYKQLIDGSWTRSIWDDAITPSYLVDNIDINEVDHQYVRFMKKRLSGSNIK